jgi:hypothetical protein
MYPAAVCGRVRLVRRGARLGVPHHCASAPTASSQPASALASAATRIRPRATAPHSDDDNDNE